MREIKFRAWDIKLQRWLMCDEYCEIELNPILDKYGNGFNLNDSTHKERGRIVQFVEYTGLIDKNGKEIYEGDVLQLKNQADRVIYVICEYGINQRIMDTGWLCDIPSFYFKRGDGLKSYPIIYNYLHKHDLEIMEIIGNIYENPELLQD